MNKQKRSVLQDWVMELGLREQGTLVVALRGCDLAPKNLLDSVERNITAWLRHKILVPFDPREVSRVPGAFMRVDLPEFKWSSIEHYPLHWTVHVAHAFQVIGCYHPNKVYAQEADVQYIKFCHSLHVNPESKEAMFSRLDEDRIATGQVVS